MALENLKFEYKNDKIEELKIDSFHSGVVGSGDMEILMTKQDFGGGVKVVVSTPVTGFEGVWDLVLSKFVKENNLGNILFEINDNNSTPFIVSLRLKQALIEAKEVG